jgi:hypothetical protein
MRTSHDAEDLSLFAGIKSQDQMSFNPPVSDEGQRLGNEFKEPEGTITAIGEDSIRSDDNGNQILDDFSKNTT